jgi:exosortase
MTGSPRSSLFFLLVAISIAAAWRALSSTFTLAWNDEQYTHLLLILPVSFLLIAGEWQRVRNLSIRYSRVGLPFLLFAVLGGGYMKWRQGLPAGMGLFISMVALVLWWWGAFILCFGIRAFKALLFPLGFLLWMAPLPSILIDPVIRFLQQGSALAAGMLFAVAGVPFVQEGLTLSIPGLTVEIAKECSGIRSSMMLLVTTMVLAQLFLSSPSKRVVAVMLAIPLAVAKNGLRIFTIAMLGTRVDRAFLTGKLHHDGGIFFFAVSLAATFLLLWILRRFEPEIGRPATWHPAGFRAGARN